MQSTPSTVNSPLVSVLMPAYNHEKFVSEAIESVLAQTYQNWELLITDDASSDQTAARIKLYVTAHPDRIRFFAQTTNQGLEANINFMLEKANGEYVAFLPSDDKYLPDKLAVEAQYLTLHQDVGLVYSDVEEINEQGHVIHHTMFPQRKCRSGKLTAQEFFSQNFPAMVMVRSHAAKAAGPWKKERGLISDLAWFFTVAMKYPITCIPRVLAQYRLHQGNTSKKVEQMLHDALEFIDEASREQKLSAQTTAQIKSRFYLGVGIQQYFNKQRGRARELFRKALPGFPLKASFALLLSFLPPIFLRTVIRLRRTV